MSTAALAVALLSIGVAGFALGWAAAQVSAARRSAEAWRYLADCAEAAEPADVPALAAGGVALALATDSTVSATVATTAARAFPVGGVWR